MCLAGDVFGNPGSVVPWLEVSWPVSLETSSDVWNSGLRSPRPRDAGDANPFSGCLPSGWWPIQFAKKRRGEGGEIEIKGGGGRLRASEGVRARDDCGIYQLACGAFRHRAWVVGEHPLEWVSILLSVRWNLVVGFSGDALSNY